MAPSVCLCGPPELQLYFPTTTIKICQGQSSSSNPCLEFFKATTYSDKPQQNPPVYQQQKDLTEYEAEAWKHDPLTTLKLIFCLRMVGRPNKEAFYKSLLWIHKNHPLTLALNLKVFAQLGLLWSYNSISVTIVNPTNDRKWSLVSYVVIRP